MSTRGDTLPDPTRLLLAQLWDRSTPLLRERLTTLVAAAEAAELGTLDPQLQTEAYNIAHKLAGSLGMFGYMEGTEMAREIEKLLEPASTPDPAALRVLTDRLRSTLPL